MSLRDIDFPSKDMPLKKDVSWLGALVGEMLQEQEGEAFYRRVEDTRRAAIRRRQGEEGAGEALQDLVCGLDPAGAGKLVRAFSAYFQVVNLAEQVHRIRRRRDYLISGDEPQPGSLRAALEELRAAGMDAPEVEELFQKLRVEPVFTAHPTEATRRVILEKEQRIAGALMERLHDPSPPEERAIRERIREEVTTAWQTEHRPAERPSVTDEREHVLFYLTDVLWDLLPELDESLEEAARAVFGPEATRHVMGGDPPEPATGDPLVRFASWVGGDMDGNPNVTAGTVRDTLDRHRELALALHRSDVESLASFLSQSPVRVEIRREVTDRLDDYASRFPEAMEKVPHRQQDLPYRVLLALVAARLDATRADGKHAYASAEELSEDLELVALSLDGHRGAHAGLRRIRRVLRRVRCFGFHLATLDGRQDALVHRRVVGALLEEDGWLEMTGEERARSLREALEEGVDPVTEGGVDDEVRQTLEVFRAFAEARRRHGTAAVGPFIVSMTEGPDDVLSVLYLARAAGFTGGDGRVPLDVAPLLETVPDLEAAPEILGALLRDPEYRDHLEARGDRQMIMIGYSDSNKDGGVAASRWALQSAQRVMVDTLEKAGVGLTIFHGRGGTVGRGGGKTHRAVLATPPGAVSGRLRVTEQGEIIHQKYGIPQIALRELERMVGATALATARKGGTDGDGSRWARIMDTLARESRRSYRGLVYENQDFPGYFRRATPIDVIERMPIGSRPPSRRSGQGIEDLRAIPWVFSWMQSRHLLPGWFGLGSGLRAAQEEHGHEVLCDMVREWPFLKTVLEDVEMVLAKADLFIAERYARLAGEVGDEIFPLIREEFELTREMVLDLRGRDRILEDDPTLLRSIRLRNPYVDPMSLLQLDLLSRWREGGREDDRLLDALIESVMGIAEGMRNTG